MVWFTYNMESHDTNILGLSFQLFLLFDPSDNGFQMNPRAPASSAWGEAYFVDRYICAWEQGKSGPKDSYRRHYNIGHSPRQ